ncbi:YebG family protein [Parendozoicomonas sp. Alg238-R29]|uniref:YebG family protein n=1 Tax=Parendozoicomonas sp. Alg238-R29 TaxID=2993446 RepID=UPI00248E1812|nr:YebG family protein [Parendozoicomonas sp. Alg238-R29]
MAVIPMWQCDRDGSMFADRKAAEEHDRMLELADYLSGFLQTQMSQANGLTEEQAEEIGLILARHKEPLSRAFKGKPSMLLELMEEEDKEEAEAV